MDEQRSVRGWRLIDNRTIYSCYLLPVLSKH